jgi:sugar phosphate permease
MDGEVGWLILGDEAMNSGDEKSAKAADHQGVSSRMQRLRWIALAMLVVSGTINYLDRGTLSVANIVIRQEMSISAAQMGFLLSAFALAYAFSQLPVGILIDRFGPRRVLGLGIFTWSVAQTVCGWVASYAQFIVARLALGVTESPQYPTAARVTANWFAMRDRGLPTGVFNTASMIGSALSPLLLTWLMLACGWRWMFAIMGLSGVTMAIIWYAFYRDPSEMRLSSSDLSYLAHESRPTARGSMLKTWGKLFRYRSVWGMVFGQMGSSYLTWLYITWLPGYLEMERHLSIKTTGFVASIPFLCGIFGSLFGGTLSDICARHGLSPINARKVPILVGLLGAASCTYGASLADSTVVCVAFISASMFCSYTGVAGIWSMPNAVAPQNVVASMGSIQNFGGYLGGALAPTVTGLVVHSTGSFVLALVTGSCVAVCAALSVLLVVRRPIDVIERMTTQGLVP